MSILRSYATWLWIDNIAFSRILGLSNKIVFSDSDSDNDDDFSDQTPKPSTSKGNSNFLGSYKFYIKVAWFSDRCYEFSRQIEVVNSQMPQKRWIFTNFSSKEFSRIFHPKNFHKFSRQIVVVNCHISQNRCISTNFQYFYRQIALSRVKMRTPNDSCW